MSKEICEGIYKIYLELKEKTKLSGHEKKWGEKIKVHRPSLKEIEEFNNIKKELMNCLDFLSDDELIEISEDDVIGEEAKKILAIRKKLLN